MISHYYSRIVWAIFGLFLGLIVGGLVELRDLRDIRGAMWEHYADLKGILDRQGE